MSDLIDDPTPGGNMPEFSVSEVSGAIKRTLEDQFGRIRVKGEVGRVFRARSGHLYYDIKDDRSVLACTTWKGQVDKLSVVPEEGLEVVVTGRLTAYGAQSKYNMNVDEVAVAGQGALMALLEKRRKTLAAEGLFDPARKRPVPFLPEVIGVVTSPSGAVIRDILHRLRERFPRKVLIWPVAVQGNACAPEVARAIEGFNRLTPGGALPRPDLIIVARGGGSVEDLWGFNEEIVVRAAAASDIPLISAVGHETDTTLIDHASDLRAPTPTAAAELAVPVRLELMATVDGHGNRLMRAVTRGATLSRQRLGDLSRGLPRPETLFDTPRQRLDQSGEALGAALERYVSRRRVTLSELGGGLRPSVLNRLIANERRSLTGTAARLGPGLARSVAARRDRFDARAQRLTPRPLQRDAADKAEKLETLTRRLSRAGTAQLSALQSRLEAADRLRETLSYKATLARGYAVVRAGEDVVTDRAAAESAPLLEIEFRDGRVQAIPQGDKPVTKPKTKATPKPPEQGTLF
ncbi:exodeoxyribonuclease VII large subunit [Chachezhania antarctica]|uniref:exodeoxyribonuclease VII large subunit n=1 Tax=Chachezhania antarctica TaxID=2340860 RepID=UPI000EAD634A|nr:exodeoxyribonuclease VII large subunit [Chachezhania antarctica]|tara:strand:+ start:11869 stop:13431 length:1563 start_codon:yes stop_codon:yes gene_type:complete